VIVRPLGLFGAPGAIRVTVGLPDENELFVSALRSLLPLALAGGRRV
jgi:histidinol-phosphate/aromatic aminotransferase/cobyric acid decarboxylase-like protein